MEQIIKKKREISHTILSNSKISALELPVEEEWAHLVYWMYGIVLSDSVTMNADAVQEILA